MRVVTFCVFSHSESYLNPLAGKPACGGTSQDRQQLGPLSQDYLVEPRTLQEIESDERASSWYIEHHYI
jgi:hypothetical protein